MPKPRNAVSEMDLKPSIELDPLAGLHIALLERFYIVQECFIRQCR